MGRFEPAFKRSGCYFPAMPQVQLRLFPVGTPHLNEWLAFACRAGQVT